MALGDRVEDPQFHIELDSDQSIVRTANVTVQTVADVDRYIVALSQMLDRARRNFGRALVLADLRAAPVRSQDVAERLHAHNLTLYRPGERVALLVESSLLKLQLRRNLVADLQNIFMSENAAITWLRAALYDREAFNASRP
ncbi:MAG: hypothetical protein V4659_07675 [Pseudomonadota bacterium]